MCDSDVLAGFQFQHFNKNLDDIPKIQCKERYYNRQTHYKIWTSVRRNDVTMTSFLALLRTQPCIGISMVFKPDFHPVVSRNHANGSSFFTFLRTYPQPSTRQHHITSHTHSLTQQRNYSPNNPCAGTRPWLDSLTPLTLRPRLQQ